MDTDIKKTTNTSYPVSILVPVYNVSPYIERCAVSLFEQTFERIEFVFVDDCSPDDSIAILNEVAERYPERKPHIKLIRHTSNRGIGASRNTLLENTSGEYLMWVDSDDFIELDMVETMIAKAYRTDADIVFCSYFQNSLEGKQYVQKIAFSESKNRILDSSFEQPSLWNKMFKLNLLLKNNLCFPLTINYGEDLSFVPRVIYYAEKFAFVEKPLYHYVQNTNSYTANFTPKHIEESLEVVKILSDFFENKKAFENYKSSVYLLKAIRKAKILRSGHLEDRYINLFPEINQEKIRTNDFKTKVLLLLAKKKQKFILKFLVFLLRKIPKI